MIKVMVTKELNETVPKDRWAVTLSNGETVYEDRIADIPPSWQRLGEYIRQNNLTIERMWGEVDGCRIELPKNQEGYVQYKKMVATGSWARLSLCIGFVQSGKCKIFMVGSDRSSRSEVMDDPGEPKTIYSGG